MDTHVQHALTSAEYLRGLAQAEITGRFRGSGPVAFHAWKAEFSQWLTALFQEYGYSRDTSLQQVEVIDELSWQGLRRTELRFQNTGYPLIVPATVLEPTERKKRGVGLVCQHGHGNFGRRSVVGDRDTPEMREEIAQHHYDFGLRFAREGYTVVAIVLFGFGERTESRVLPSGRDPCDMLGLFMLAFGRNLVVEQVSSIQKGITLLAAWKGVDPERIGMAGLSQGGRMTMFTSALDERIKVAVVSGSHNTFGDRIGTQAGLCGAQIVPKVMPHADTPDILAAIAPRPLQLQWGRSDPLIVHGPASAGIAHMERCYRAAGADERFAVDTFDGGHRFDFGPALSWFDKWL